MAEKDEKKLYRPRPSSLQRWANDATGRFFQGAANVADRYAGGAGARKVLKAPLEAAARVRSDKAINDALRTVRNSGGIRYGDQAAKLDSLKQRWESRQYDKPAQKTPEESGNVVQNPVDNGNVRQSTGRPDRVVDTGIVLTNRGGNPRVLGDVEAFKQRDRAMRRPSNATRVGNMDVQFDPSVSQAARNRFMAQPTAPGTRRVPGIGMVRGPERPSQNQGQAPRTFGDVMREKWRMANERQQSDISGKQADRNLAQTKADRQFQIARGNLAINAQDTASASALRQQQAAQAKQGIEAGQLSLEQERQIADLKQQWTAAKDPEERSRISQMINTLREREPQREQFKPITKKHYDKFGNVVDEEFGTFAPFSGRYNFNDQSDPVMSALQENPRWKEAFDRLPEEERAKKYQEILAFLQSQQG